MKASREQVDAEVMLSRREMKHGRSVNMRERASIIVALADERDDLRRALEESNRDRPVWARLEEIAGALVEDNGRLQSRKDLELAAIRIERDDLLALVNDPEAGNGCWASNDGAKKTEACDGQYNADGELTAPVCWQHRAWELVAKTQGGK